MDGEAWAFLGVAVSAVGAFMVAIRQSRTAEVTTGRSASAEEVRALGERLDTQNARMDRQDRTIRALYAYIALDHHEHRRQGWPVIPLPDEIQ